MMSRRSLVIKDAHSKKKRKKKKPRRSDHTTKMRHMHDFDVDNATQLTACIHEVVKCLLSNCEYSLEWPPVLDSI
jgi:hypothetical protein